ncbi:MAG TPA: hypothetical protein VGC96_13165 [Candidatus Elarobacter sp.]|jgi:hypothetical protein
MHALSRLLAGLVLVHVLGILFYVTGTLIDRDAPVADPDDPAKRGATAFVDLVVRVLAGAAMWGLAIFAAGALGALRWWGLALVLLAFGLAFRARGENPLGARFWRSRFAALGAAWDWRALCVYYAVLATSVPAVLPDADSDSQRVHLAYAASWASAGKIYVDYLLRGSLYADNVELFFAGLETLRLGALNHFITWFFGAISCVAVCALLELADAAVGTARSRLERIARDAVVIALPIAIAISPTVLRWNAVGFVDVPLAAFMFGPALCAAAMLLGTRSYLTSLALTGAFLAGSKPSLLLFVPAFVILAFAASRRFTDRPLRAAVWTAMVIVALGSPWYVRNIAVDGDPVPPMFNARLHRPDKMTAKADQGALSAFLGEEDRSPKAIATVPYRAWWSPTDPGLAHGDKGTTALIVLLYGPFLVLGFAALSPRFGAVTGALLATAFMAALGGVYWVMFSYNLRYVIPFLPALAAFAGIGFIAAAAAGGAWRWAVLAAAIACTIPSPGSVPWLRALWETDYVHLQETFPSDEAYLRRNLPAYAKVQAILATPEYARRPAGRVYEIFAEADYEFRRHGVSTMGDFFGPGRYRGFYDAVDDRQLEAYVDKFHIGAVIVAANGSAMSPDQLARMRDELHRIGFVDVRTDEEDAFYAAVRRR